MNKDMVPFRYSDVIAMDTETKKMNRRKLILVISLEAAAFLFIVLAGIRLWSSYRSQIMKNHADQLLDTAQVTADNMTYTLQAYRGNLQYLKQIREELPEEEVQTVFEDFLSDGQGFETDILELDPEGNVLRSIRDTKLRDGQEVTTMEDGESIWEYNDNEQGIHLLSFDTPLEDGNTLALVIDAGEYYKELISGIHIGTNGYIMIKNAEGIILMHPSDVQWGIDVIKDREILFPDADLTSLKELVAKQSRGGSGVMTFYSYWWDTDPTEQVQKISGYAPVPVKGDDFWVVSAVVDYDDYYGPIRRGIMGITILFGVGMIVMAVFFAYTVVLLREQNKNAREIETLQKLNARLEEVHKGEEVVAHHQRLELMGTMTGGIAHEINNVLTPIMGYAELLMMQEEEGSDAYDSAEEIYNASVKAKDIVKQISSLSRRNMETVLRSVPAAKLVNRAYRMMESICPKNVELSEDIHLEDEMILANSTQINQVLLNLCVNAVQAIGGKEDGKIVLSAETMPLARVRSTAELSDQTIPDDWERYVHISLSDNGCGMDPETLSQIFTLFFTTKKSGEGTGLGLSLAQQFVTSHRGYIYAESTKGKGSVFHVLLPVLEAGDQEKEVSVVSGEKPDIVIADDNAKILHLLERNFARLGMQIRTFQKREDLAAALQEKQPDVLVIDETLQTGRGLDFCMSISGQYEGMLKILMADAVTDEIVEARQKSIIDAYILKPVSDTAILDTVWLLRRGGEKEQTQT